MVRATTPASRGSTIPARFGHPLRVVLCVLLWTLQGCASLTPVEKAESFALPAPQANALGQIAKNSVGDAEAGFRPLAFSRFSMDARLALARHATSSLDVQYYLLQNDPTGRLLLRALRDAAARGVRVRILVDDMYTADSDQLLLQLAAHPNVEVRLFNPFPSGRAMVLTRWAFSLFDFARVNRRMHNKMFIADGALVWSRQRADELQSAFNQATADSSTALLSLAANETDPVGFTPLGSDLLHPPISLLHGSATPFADDPEKASGRSFDGKDPTTVMSRVLEALQDSHDDVLLMSPYFVPGEKGMNALQHLRMRGVRVTLVTNTLAANDEPLASAEYARYRKRMLKIGVDIYEVSSKQLKTNPRVGPSLGTTIGRSHAKLIVFDRRRTFIGSMNMDLRSSRTNTEVGLLIDSPEFAVQIGDLVATIRSAGSYHVRLSPATDDLEWVTYENGAESVSSEEPEVDAITRLKVLLLAPFVAESLL
jgi:cardiolipin synthase C